jgi:hypothetical protein
MMAAGDGLVSMAPTSIAYSGTSAGINADGGVDFSAVTSLSLNGVFTSAYDNYVVVIYHYSSGNPGIDMRLRLSGTDANGANYTWQRISVENTTITGSRSTNDTLMKVGYSGSTARSGDNIHFYGPALAQPTATRNVNARGLSGASIGEMAGTHSLSTAYDGFTLLGDGGTVAISGSLHVFGYEE